MTEQEWQESDDPRAMLASLAGGAGGEWPEFNDPQLKVASSRGLAGGRSLPCFCCRTECDHRGGLCPAYRKLRLFACACCRCVLPLLPETVCRPSIEGVEQYADGAVEEEEWVRTAHAFDDVRRSRFPKQATPDDGAWTALYCAVHRCWEARFDEAYSWDRWRLAWRVAEEAADSAGTGEAAVQALLLREVFGNPFGRVALDSASRTTTTHSLAQAADEDRELPSGHLDRARLAILADALEETGCSDRTVLDHLRGRGPHVRGCFVLDLILGKE